MAETITELGTGGGLDLKQFQKLQRDLRAFSPSKEMHKALRVAGQMIAADARVLVAGHSKSVPPSIRVRVRGTTISVVSGGPGVPLAGLLELGNKGHRKSQVAAASGVFRHPVYQTSNRNVWVDQKMHPYLLRATQKNEKGIEKLEGEAVKAEFARVDLPMEG